MSDTLPTIEECQTFLALVNKGREAAGLDALETLDFDGAQPSNGDACLSATNLYRATKTDHPVFVDSDFVEGGNPKVHEAVGAEFRGHGEWHIPAAIKAVTDPFDREVSGLRARLVEAGVVAP